MKEFFTYYRAAFYGNVRYSTRRAWNLEYFLIIISGLLVAGATACLNSSSIQIADTENTYSGTMFIYAAVFIYVAALSMGTNRSYKPSVLTLAPISYKKRAVYSHLTVLLFGLIFVTAWFLFMSAGILIVSVFALIFTGDWVFLPAFLSNAGLVYTPPVQGVLFVIFLIFTVFGAGMAISYIPNKKVRYSLMFAFPAVYGAVALLIANLASVDGKFTISNNLIYNFIQLPLSWVWLAAFAVIAVAVCALSVSLAIKYEKPKDY